MALNNLASPEHYPDDYSVKVIDGVRIKYFPAWKYNFYYFDEGWNTDARILHYKGIVRKYYPTTFLVILNCYIKGKLKKLFRKFN